MKNLVILFLFLILPFTFGCNDENQANNDDESDGNVDTWIDPVSDLMWQQNGKMGVTQEEAEEYCEELSAGGYHDWRVPTISELRSLIRGCAVTEVEGKCHVSDSCLGSNCRNDECNGCENSAGPGFEGRYWPDHLRGDVWDCWSSSEVSDYSENKWMVNYFSGGIGDAKDSEYDIRCVR